MAKDNGGVIGVLNTPTSTSASGVWQLMSEYQARLSGTWPAPFNIGSSSARFNSGSSDYLNRTPSTTTDRQKATLSFWTKYSDDTSGNVGRLFNFGLYPNGTLIYFGDGAYKGKLLIDNYAATVATIGLVTTQLFRDYSAWYHIVVAFDTTQATASNRVKLYVNGTQVTTFDAAVYPSQNENLFFNFSSSTYQIGKNHQPAYFSGYLAETYMIDGQQLTPSSFGQTDSTTGIWIPKAYTGTYGTNGFYLNFSNASSLGTDASGNGNNFTVNNLTSVDQSKDHPTNNWCTLNPLFPLNDNLAFANGNLQATKASGSATGSYYGNFGVNAGKWYWEMKCTATGGADQWIGVGQMRTLAPSGYPGNDTYCIAAGHTNAALRYNGSNVGTYTMATWTAGDIIMMALDMDNSKVYWGKNGTWQNSGSPAAGTGAYTNSTIFDGNFIMPVGSLYQSGGDVSYNFGQPSLSVSGGYSDGNGYGNFTYQPPSGYLALCTNNLASNG